MALKRANIERGPEFDRLRRRQRLILEHQLSRFSVSVALRALVVIALWLPMPLALGGALVFGAYQENLPATPSLLAPPPGSSTQVTLLDGHPVGGLHRGLAPWVRYDDIPTRVVLAFLAAEDDEFFLHHGVDLSAVARAALVNLRAGGIRQGGSTITQQVAKMFVGTSRTFERKLIEMMLARRIEATFSKEEILESYLNRIYLGAGVNGVVAAARIYFDNSLDGLSLSEAATLAGIASAPSAFEPYDHPERAQLRRNLVLERMAELGFVTFEQSATARNEPVSLRERGEVPDPPLPYVTDTIRTRLMSDYGEDVWRYGALRVQTGLSTTLQRYGDLALIEGVSSIDRRQGYRGPLRRGVDVDRAAFDGLVATHFDALPFRPALVVDVTSDRLTLHVDSELVELGAESWSWAAPYDSESTENDAVIEAIDDVLAPGDVVLVVADDRTEGEPSDYLLTQVPRLEGALISVDLDTGYVQALVGGYDYDRSQYNRVTQGCRQPGSVFKPVIYSRALEMGRTLVTRLVDAPIQLRQGAIEVWRPRNSDGDFRGVISLRDALILSRNLPTIRLFRQVGVNSVVRRAEALGFTTPMDPTDALSLGASCVLPVDVATAYSVFANEGYRHRPILLVSVVDGRGELIRDQGVFFDGTGSASSVLDRAFNDIEEVETQVIDPRTAFLIRHVLSDVVRLGTGHLARALGVPAAGKTGTTTAYDVWFVGFTESLVTAVWVGSDRNTRPLGRGETGAEVALPIWLDYMSRALDGRSQGSLIDSPPEGIRSVRVDLATGLLAQEGAPGAWLPFIEGTEPTEFAPTPEQRDLAQADRVDDEL